jgi:hypothetical protein
MKTFLSTGRTLTLAFIACLAAANWAWAAPADAPSADSEAIALSSLSFAITGGTHPPLENSVAGYPVSVITQIWQDIQASPQPAFAIGTGNYMFSYDSTTGTATAQLDDYLTARNAYSKTFYPAMGQEECDGTTTDNCTSTSGIALYNYDAFVQLMLQPVSQTQPYYTINFAGTNNAWTAKFVFVACNAWSTTQASWLSTALSQATTYTFVVWGANLTDTQNPCLTGTGSDNFTTILNSYPYSLLISGGTGGTYQYNAPQNEVVVSNGGEPLTNNIDYGYVIAQQQTNGQIVFVEYDYLTNVAQAAFEVGPTVIVQPVAKVKPASLTFPSRKLGTTSPSKNVTLTNTGNGALTIYSIATSGDFAQINNCGTSLAPAASCTIAVSFTPTASGTLTGTLTIADNSQNNTSSQQTVSLTGTGE